MKVFLSNSLCDEAMELLRKRVDVFDAKGQPLENYLREITTADGLIIRIGEINAQMIQAATKLKVIGRTGVGFDNIDVLQATKQGVPVVITPGANALSVAEHTMALLFALSKQLIPASSQLKLGNWNVRDQQKSVEIHGKTLALIGFGEIGKKVVQLALGLGMKVYVYDPYVDAEEIEKFNAVAVDQVGKLLEIADFLSIHIPLLPTTRDFLTITDLKKMKNTAYLINCSRGGIVSESTLVEALDKGYIAGVALDVFEKEPLPEDALVLQRENIICTPHSAAQTKEAARRMHEMCVKGCLAVLEGEMWPNVADKSVYHTPVWKKRISR